MESNVLIIYVSYAAPQTNIIYLRNSFSGGAMSKKSFVGGAVILMLAGFIVRILGFVYRIYLSNLIGAEGMGLFQLISPVYSLIILTLTSGISIAVSRMVAAEMAQNRPANCRRITSCALALVVSGGIVVALGILCFGRFISREILNDTRTYYSLILMMPCVPVIAAASAIKGYFYGIQDVVPTAISQVVEQVVRIGLVMAMAAYFLNIGLEYACALATVGMAVGEISNLLVVYIVYVWRKRRAVQGRITLRRRRIVGEILKVSIPVSINRFIISIMGAVEMILIPRALGAGGLDYQASISEFGRLAGMAMPLLYFPSLVTSSLATTLVPAIAEATSVKNFKLANYRISRSIQLSFIMGFIFTVIFFCYPDAIGNLLYRKEKIGGLLQLLSFTCIFMYLQQTLLGTMNGLNKQGISLRNSIIGSSIRIGFVWFGIPHYGIPGYIWGCILSSACVCLLNLATVIKTTGMHIDLEHWILKPGLIGLVMILISKYIYSFFTIFGLSSTWVTLLAVIANIFIALWMMMMIGALEKEELFRMLGLKKLNKGR